MSLALDSGYFETPKSIYITRPEKVNSLLDAQIILRPSAPIIPTKKNDAKIKTLLRKPQLLNGKGESKEVIFVLPPGAHVGSKVVYLDEDGKEQTREDQYVIEGVDESYAIGLMKIARHWTSLGKFTIESSGYGATPTHVGVLSSNTTLSVKTPSTFPSYLKKTDPDYQRLKDTEEPWSAGAYNSLLAEKGAMTISLSALWIHELPESPEKHCYGLIFQLSPHPFVPRPPASRAKRQKTEEVVSSEEKK